MTGHKISEKRKGNRSMLKRQFNKENATYYMLCFFPLYGIIIGAVMYALSILCLHFGFGQSCYALIGAVVPVFMGGGAHLRDFMGISDVLSSILSGEKKPEQKNDPIGAYAVIAAASYYLLYAGGLALIWKDRQLALLGIGYVISRTLHSMAFVWFPEAKKERQLYTPVSLRQKRALRVILSVILALCFCTCIAISPIMGMLEALLCMWVWTYFYYMSRRMFGGITKESAGYFLALCELVAVLFIGMFGRVLL